jgi:hypothetical protein
MTHDDLLARLTTLDPADFRRLKALLRAAGAGTAPVRWYHNLRGRGLWHVTDRPVHPDTPLSAACGSSVILEEPPHLQPPADAHACQACRRSHLAQRVFEAPTPPTPEELERLVQAMRAILAFVPEAPTRPEETP